LSDRARCSTELEVKHSGEHFARFLKRLRRLVAFWIGDGFFRVLSRPGSGVLTIFSAACWTWTSRFCDIAVRMAKLQRLKGNGFTRASWPSDSPEHRTGTIERLQLVSNELQRLIDPDGS
jgi:hypothetical protein